MQSAGRSILHALLAGPIRQGLRKVVCQAVGDGRGAPSLRESESGLSRVTRGGAPTHSRPAGLQVARPVGHTDPHTCSAHGAPCGTGRVRCHPTQPTLGAAVPGMSVADAARPPPDAGRGSACIHALAHRCHPAALTPLADDLLVAQVAGVCDHWSRSSTRRTGIDPRLRPGQGHRWRHMKETSGWVVRAVCAPRLARRSPGFPLPRRRRRPWSLHQLTGSAAPLISPAGRRR